MDYENIGTEHMNHIEMTKFLLEIQHDGGDIVLDYE